MQTALQIKMKTCTMCNISRPITEFHACNRNKRDGRCARCKTCRAVKQKNSTKFKYYQKIYALKNRISLNEKTKNYALNNNGKVKKSQKKSYEKRKQYYNQKGRDYHLANKQYISSKLKSRISNLEDKYLSRMLCKNSNIAPRDIPQGLINAKREHLRIKRQLKLIKEAA